MSNNLKRLIIGAHLNYSLDGAAITNGGGAAVSGVGIKPDGTAPGDWISFGTVEQADVKTKDSVEEIMAPSPGAYRRLDQVRTSVMTDLEITTFEVQEILLRSLLRSGAITNASPFTPDSALGEVRGWWQLKKYAQNDALVLDWQFYGLGIVHALSAVNKLVKPKFEIAKFYNVLESGISTLAAAA